MQPINPTYDDIDDSKPVIWRTKNGSDYVQYKGYFIRIIINEQTMQGPSESWKTVFICDNRNPESVLHKVGIMKEALDWIDKQVDY